MSKPLIQSNIPGLPCRRGKVRDVYDLGDRLVIVATDRISAFDWVLPTPIPDKGAMLTGLTAFWLDRLGVPNHLLSLEPKEMGPAFRDHTDVLAGRSMLVQKTDVVPIECVVRGVPPGLGEPVFDKLEAELAKAMLSLPATKGFEIGSGFAGTKQRGSEHNDAFRMEGDRVRTATNRSGGVQGGISNGEPIFFRVAFKPTATIFKPQQTVTTTGEDTELQARGRHDPCVLPRAVPMVEAMTAIVLCDHALRQRAQMGTL